MLIAGSDIEAISAAVGAMLNTIDATTASSELVAVLVNSVNLCCKARCLRREATHLYFCVNLSAIFKDNLTK